MPKGDFSGREKRLFLPALAFRFGPEGFFCFGGVMGDKITVPHILKMKQRGEKITCLTAYDYSFARILDEAGVEMLLVGDSLGCVVQGQPNTLAVTMDEMIYHTRLVARGRKRALADQRHAVSVLSDE